MHRQAPWRSLGKGLIGMGLLALGGCSGGTGENPGEVPSFDAIGEGEIITTLGTEPFWSAQIDESALTWSTPDNIDGNEIAITRFAGNGGLGVSGTLEGAALQMAITPGDCSDGMSDRIYPYIVTVTIGEAQLNGCGYTDTQSFTGEGTP